MLVFHRPLLQYVLWELLKRLHRYRSYCLCVCVLGDITAGKCLVRRGEKQLKKKKDASKQMTMWLLVSCFPEQPHKRDKLALQRAWSIWMLGGWREIHERPELPLLWHRVHLAGVGGWSGYESDNAHIFFQQYDSPSHSISPALL